MCVVITVATTVRVDAPAAQVWAVLADYSRDVEWRAGVRSMVPTPAGPVRPGTTTAEVLRAAGRTTHNDGVVTEVGPGHRFGWRTTAGVRAEGSRAVLADATGGCRVELTLRVVPPGVLRRVPRLLTGMLRRGLVRDADRLRSLVERGGAPQASAPGPIASSPESPIGGAGP